MAKLSYVNTGSLVLPLKLTIHELTIIDRFFTKHGAGYSNWSDERELHKELHDILRTAYTDAADTMQWQAGRQVETIEYHVEVKADKVDEPVEA